MIPWRVAVLRSFLFSVCAYGSRPHTPYKASLFLPSLPLSPPTASPPTASPPTASPHTPPFSVSRRLPSRVSRTQPYSVAGHTHSPLPPFSHFPDPASSVIQQHTARRSLPRPFRPLSGTRHTACQLLSIGFSLCFSSSFFRSSDGASGWRLRGWFCILGLLAPFSKTDQTALQ